MTNMDVGEHVMAGSAVASSQSHNDYLIFTRKEVVCILSVVMRMLLKQSFTPWGCTAVTLAGSVLGTHGSQ